MDLSYFRPWARLAQIAAVSLAALLASPLGPGPAVTFYIAAFVAGGAAAALVAASVAAGNGVPLTRDAVALAALDLYADGRVRWAAARAALEASLMMRGDPFGWGDTLHPMRGRPILVDGRPVRAFRVVAAPEASRGAAGLRPLVALRALSAAAPRALPAAAWLYRAHPEPEIEDWQHCADLYEGPHASASSPHDPPPHALDLYDDGGLAFGVSVAVRLCNRGGFPMQRGLELRRGGQVVATADDTAPLGGLGPEAMVKAALAAGAAK